MDRVYRDIPPMTPGMLYTSPRTSGRRARARRVLTPIRKVSFDLTPKRKTARKKKRSRGKRKRRS